MGLAEGSTMPSIEWKLLHGGVATGIAFDVSPEVDPVIALHTLLETGSTRRWNGSTLFGF